MPPELGWVDVGIRLAVATGLAGLIGAERELRERAAGLRTHILVALGSCLFTMISAYAWSDFFFDDPSRIDPTRIAAQVVTGIVFLGAGAILRQGLSVRGLTTAAGLWTVAAIGMAAGAGFYSGAVLATVIALIAFGPFKWLERAVNRAGGDRGYLEVTLPPEHTLATVIESLERRRARIYGIEFETREGAREVRIEVELPSASTARDVVEELSEDPLLTHVRWSG